MAKCSICNSPNLTTIDDLLGSGEFQRDVAAQFGVSRFALSRHVRHSKAALAATSSENGDSESLETQAEKWLRRADDIYVRAITDGDVKGQVASLGAAFRGLELQHKAELKAVEAAPARGDGTPVTIEEIDRIVQSAIGDRRAKLIDRIFAAPEATLTAVENILESRQVSQ